ncbi:bifunctional 3'-5' exonuclease/ATP-dependent helicase WRN-like [Asterias amurensis]|uniref:bifunctional 3'-5' exonuclease/ATP-dependent helicase WRN-like n=1 Tax=Asterias amurensis TaxID=7602 RepID=UPI003AB3724A
MSTAEIENQLEVLSCLTTDAKQILQNGKVTNPNTIQTSHQLLNQAISLVKEFQMLAEESMQRARDEELRSAPSDSWPEESFDQVDGEMLDFEDDILEPTPDRPKPKARVALPFGKLSEEDNSTRQGTECCSTAFQKDETNNSLFKDKTLSPEEKKETEDIMNYLQDFEDDINEDMLQQFDAVCAAADEESSSQELKNEESDDSDTDEENYDPSVPPPEQKYIDVLKTHFGHARFRPMQWKIIHSVLTRRDQCVVMATGYGKSLCYQYPAVFTGGTSLVISPLISLMEDQVFSLSIANIKACLLGSAQSAMGRIKQEALNGDYRVVYLTPEFASEAHKFLRDLQQRVGITLVAIDEAHCVSQWGHDFRAAYRTLGEVRTLLPEVPFVALTATATPEIRKDICKSLRLKNPQVTCTSFDRPNLYLEVNMKGDIASDLQSLMVETRKLYYEFDGPTIIYCPTKKATEKVGSVLQQFGVKSGIYHAGLSPSIRKQTHHKFVRDELQCIVATVAFGMGIDKPDVRNVVHYGAPKDIESYYQEIGRAGRDGMPSTCYVFYAPGDFATNRFFLRDIQSAAFKAHKSRMMQKMEQYLVSIKCRRRSILSHFEANGNTVSAVMNTDQCCDNCKHKDSPTGGTVGSDEKDFSKELHHLLTAIEATGGRFGLSVPILFLRGSLNQRLPSHCQKSKDFGCGKYHPEKWWKSFARMALTEGYLAEKQLMGGFGSTVELSSKGYRWLKDAKYGQNSSFKMVPNKEMLSFDKNAVIKPTVLPQTAGPQILPSVQVSNWKQVSYDDVGPGPSMKAAQPKVDLKEQQLQGVLYSKLMNLRNSLAAEMGAAPYMVANNKNLHDLAIIRPSSKQSLLKIDGIAEARAEKFGARLIEAICEFCKENSLKMDNFPATVPSHIADTKKTQGVVFQRSSIVHQISDTVRESYNLYHEKNMSLGEVAKERNLKETTVGGHLAEAIKAGYPVNFSKLGVSQSLRKQIEDVIRSPPINSDISRLAPIKALLPESVDWYQIKVVLAVLQVQYGMPTSVGSSDSDKMVPDRPTTSSSEQLRSQAVPYRSPLQTRPAPARSTNPDPSVSLLVSPTMTKSKSHYGGMTSSSQSTQQSGTKRKLPTWLFGSAKKGKLNSGTATKKANSLFAKR